jgi:hypothetical protein
MARLTVVVLMIGVAACGTTEPAGIAMGDSARVTGNVTMFNPDPDSAISGLTFQNGGANDVTVDDLKVTAVGGGTSPAGFGFGVQAGDSTGFLIDIVNHKAELEHVETITFVVEGTTDLTVTTTTTTGYVPGTAP